jgi:hypothetical protein
MKISPELKCPVPSAPLLLLHSAIAAMHPGNFQSLKKAILLAGRERRW